MTAFRFPPSADKMSADLYFHGLAAVDATLPSAGIVMPSTAMSCVNCHGADGQGGREGGVAVPPISWRRLSMVTADRPAYDAARLARALRDGIGADGTALHEIMPRCAVSEADAAHLAAWLSAIGPEHERGVSDDEIIIATTSTIADDPRPDAIATVLRYYMDDLNRKVGLYGRTIRLVDEATDGQRAFARLAALEPSTRSDDAPLDLWPLNADGEQRAAYALIPSDERLLRSLLEAAKRDDPDARRLSIPLDDRGAPPDTFVFDGSREALSSFINSWSGPVQLTIYTTPDRVDLEQLRDLPRRPLRMMLANPLTLGLTDPDVEASDHRLAFERAAGQLALAGLTRPWARAAWVAASMLEEGLRSTGRRLDRRRLEGALHAMPDFASGLLLPVHPARGPTSTALISFDLARKKVKQQTLTLD